MALHDDPALDPDRIAARRFSTSFRGFDPDEVQAFLREISNALRVERASEADAVRAIPTTTPDPQLEKAIDDLTTERDRLAATVEALEAKLAALPDPTAELDEAQLTKLLGAETTRVLETARTAAANLTRKAEEDAQARRDDIDKMKASTVAQLTEQKRLADEKAGSTVAEAEKRAASVVNEAESEAARLRESSADAAAQTKSAAERDARKTRTDAEAAAQEAKAAAAEVATAVKARAEEVAKQTRLAAETDAAKQADSAQRVKAEAEAEAAKIRASAEADAEAANERAREEARQMVNEAQAVREKILEDLVKRRRIGRQQLDQAKAARDRLARALGHVRKQLDEAATELEISVPEARKAMEMAARRTAVDDSARQAAEMAVDLDAAKAAGVPVPGVAGENGADDDAADDDLDGLFARIRAERERPASTDDKPEERPVDAVEESSAGTAAVAVDTAPGPEEESDEGSEADDSVPADEADEEESDEVEVPSPFAERDVAVTRQGPDLRRQLKRSLADDQSEVLDGLRRARRTVTVADLPDPEVQLAAFIDAATPALRETADAGARVGGRSRAPKAAVDELVDRVVRSIAEPLRARVEDAVARADGDTDGLLEPVRAHYRQTRIGVLPSATDDALAEAFALGLYAALPNDTGLRWVADPRVDAGPDCTDNTLETSVSKPQPFPTGHLHPPGSPGCRCLVVAAE